MQTIRDLEAALVEKLARLDEERRINAEANAKERAERIQEAEIERQQRLEEYKEKIAVHEAKRKAEENEREAQRIKETAVRVAAEQKQNELDETLRLQREKLEWLTTAISNAEFTEEQHRKSLESMRVFTQTAVESIEVSTEYPQTCAEGGTSVAGTDGSTPDSPLMSNHLREILRQANRA